LARGRRQGAFSLPDQGKLIVLAGFLTELRRRHVLNVAVVYVVIAWIIIQVVTAIFPPLHIPDWAQTFVVVLLIIGFPVALILAWAFDITPKGLVRDTADSAIKESSGIYRAGLDARKSLLMTALILAVGVGLWLFLPQPDSDWSGTEPVASSIAVLPFVDMSEAGDNEHFTDGLTEALLHDLANIPGLKVAARTSSFAFKNQDSDIRVIGETLDVATVLEGSVRKSGDDLKITAQLISVDDGYHLWSETYDARMDDIFAIQEQISRAIADALKIRLLPDSAGSGPSTKDAGAYGLYLQGVGSLRAAEIGDHFDEAIDLFNQALRRDPVFAEAEAGLCSAYWAKYESTKDTKLVDLALSTCDRANVQNPHSPEVHIALGGIYAGTGRTEFAIEAYTQAVTLSPDSDDAHRGLGAALQQAKRAEEAEASFRKSIELNSGYWRNHSRIAYFFVTQGRFPEAVDAYTASLDLNPDNSQTWSNLGGLLFLMADFEGAAEAFSYSLAYNPTAVGYSNAGTNYYYAGDFPKAREMFEKAVELSPHDFRLVGNLADACQMVSESCDADVYYRQALGLANDQLQVDPSDASVLAMTAVYEAQLGNADQAIQMIRRARDRDATNPEVLWNAGIIYALVGDEQQAVRVLNAAVAAGYPRELVAADPTLAPLADRIATTN